MFPPFSLPSKPIQQVLMREATTAEALDFCDVMADREEALTTKFLNTVQDKEQFECSSKWTAEDRMLAKFWYWLHTTEDTYTELEYDCQWCGKKHIHSFDMRDLAERYTEMQGMAMRDLTFEDRKLVISPLTGLHMEQLERMRDPLSSYEDGSAESERLLAEIRFNTLKSSLYLADDHEKSERKRDNTLNDWLMNLPASKYKRLQKAVDELLGAMRHGLASTIKDGKIMLKSPAHQCPEMQSKGKEATTELLLPFRDYSGIPRV